MARRIIWTQSAVRDLEEIAGFIERDSRFYAASVIRKTRLAAQSLKTSPERGRVVPEIDDPHIREIFVWNYRLIYKVLPESVSILTIVHGARDLESMWRRRGSSSST